MTTTGKHAAYQINHARILLKADRNQPGGGWRDTEIQSALDRVSQNDRAGAKTIRRRGDGSGAEMSDGGPIPLG